MTVPQFDARVEFRDDGRREGPMLTASLLISRLQFNHEKHEKTRK